MASEERIPVEVKDGNSPSAIDNALIVCTLGQVREDLPDLGYLDPGADCKDLKRGTKYIFFSF